MIKLRIKVENKKKITLKSLNEMVMFCANKCQQVWGEEGNGVHTLQS